MSLYFNLGSEKHELSRAELEEGMFLALRALGSRNRVLAIPPDFTRYYSRAGELTRAAYQFYGDALRAVLPAVGTHAPVSAEQREKMFTGVPSALFHHHNWRKDVVRLGEVPSAYVQELSESKLDYAWPVEVNRLVADGGFDLILSLGQVVPHEFWLVPADPRVSIGVIIWERFMGWSASWAGRTIRFASY